MELKFWVLVVAVIFLLPSVHATLTCNVQTGCDYTTVFKMSGTENAHAELYNESNYNYNVCCNDDQYLLSNECSGTYAVIVNLSSATSAHAEYSGVGYPFGACLKSSGSLSCRYDTSCTSDEACLASISGQTNAHVASCSYYSTKICCLTTTALGRQPYRVSFQLEFNISGAGGDTAQAGTNGTGAYGPKDLIDYYACLQDTSVSDTPTFGIVFAGGTFQYINLTSGTKGGSFELKIAQGDSRNRFILPITKGGCSTIGGKMNLVKTYGTITQPFFPFLTDIQNTVELILSYPGVDIIGDFVKTGRFTLNIEKNESGGITQLIFRD